MKTKKINFFPLNFVYISQESISNQENNQFFFHFKGKSIIDGSCSMISAAKSLALNPKDPPTWQALANHSKSVSDSIKKLVSSIRDKAPGQKECDDVIAKLSNCVRQLDQASLSAISQNLAPRRDKSAEAYAEQTVIFFIIFFQ